MEYKEYLYKTYSAWLGKNIGIRLGAPVENFSYEKVRELYGDKKDYPVDYDIFAADDDSNGPLFFSRVLLDYDELTYENFGNTILNYLQEYKGFFWWGGEGVSSEHTAYENLKSGIMPPFSGSYKVNGKTIAEQIGGQIFSDCWGYMALGNPEKAKKMAQIASSATHDLCGIEGGIFVAVCIALAYTKNSIYEVIDEALNYLNKDLEYYQVVKDIISFYVKDKDFENCFKYIRDNYGYDKYPGVCHIIPNTCVMVAGMLYGEGDFEKTLLLINNCGWDTDCNCGNVGSIMGALVGVDNIDKKWILPINDIVNSSSCVGSLNIDAISNSAKMYVKLAYKLEGIEVNDDEQFDLPYATLGFRGNVCVKDNCLYADGEIYKYTYYEGKDIYDSRYDPSFSPVVSCGDEVIVSADKDVKVFVETMDGVRYEGVNSLLIPNGTNDIIHKIGVCSNNYKISKVTVKHHPKLDYDFRNWNYDIYGPRYAGDYLTNIRGFVLHHGNFVLEDGLRGKGFITTGHLEDTYKSITVNYEMVHGDGFELLYNCKGYKEYYSLYLENGRGEIRHNNECLFKFECSLKDVNTVTLKKDSIVINDQIIEYHNDRISSLIGFNCDSGNAILVHSLKTE